MATCRVAVFANATSVLDYTLPQIIYPYIARDHVITAGVIGSPRWSKTPLNQVLR